MDQESGTRPASLPGGFSKGQPLLVQEGYKVRTIIEEAGYLEAYRLRYSVFSRELGWSAATEGKLDMDRYDRSAESIGLYNSENVLTAYLRVVSRPGAFMLEDEFSALVGKRHVLRYSTDTAEVSRFCMEPQARRRTVFAGGRDRSLSILLVKGLYLWCIRRRVRYVYAVMEEKARRFFRSLGLPLARVGAPVEMPDGTLTGAYLLDWREFERINRSAFPGLMEWYSVQLDQSGR